MADYTGTGPITSRGKTLFKHYDNQAKVVSLVNGSGALIEAGREVYLSNDGTVSYRTTGVQVPIGVVTVGNVANELVSVLVYGKGWIAGTAKGGTLNEGDLVRQDGTVDATNGTPNYIVVATAGHFVTGIVIEGAAAGGNIQVLSLDSPIKF